MSENERLHSHLQKSFTHQFPDTKGVVERVVLDPISSENELLGGMEEVVDKEGGRDRLPQLAQTTVQPAQDLTQERPGGVFLPGQEVVLAQAEPPHRVLKRSLRSMTESLGTELKVIGLHPATASYLSSQDVGPKEEPLTAQVAQRRALTQHGSRDDEGARPENRQVMSPSCVKVNQPLEGSTESMSSSSQSQTVAEEMAVKRR